MFDNVTLASTTPSTFVVPSSSGIANDGPIAPAGEVTRRDVDGAPGGRGATTSAGPRIVDESSLSRRTAPPSNLDELLTRNYPRAAQDAGLEGVVHVRAVVGPDGRVADVQPVGDPGHGFADACRRTLQASRWPPPLDRDGVPVSQRIRFDCAFQIRAFL